MIIWLSAYKNSLNDEKTKIAICRLPRKMITDNIKTELGEKRLYPTNLVTNVCVKTNRFLHWHDHVIEPCTYTHRTNSLLIMIRNFVEMKTLENIYFAISYSRISYSCIPYSCISLKPFFSAKNIFSIGNEITLEKFCF